MICLGTRVSLVLPGGEVRRRRGSLLYDPAGKDWPRCSLLVAPFERSGADAGRVPAFARKWFGEEYEPSRGSVRLPERDLSAWHSIGEVERLYFTRGGDVPEEEGVSPDMDHPFGSAGVFGRALFLGGAKPVAYVLGDATRVELGSGCALTRRGIERP